MSELNSRFSPQMLDKKPFTTAHAESDLPLQMPQTMTLIGTYPPRKCGIATFTQDLRNAIAGQISTEATRVIAIDDTGSSYEYDPSVEFRLPQQDRASYRLAAELMNANQIDVALVQHEYGIFGGDDGSHVLDLIGRLRMPVITTLHTILSKPSQGQRDVLMEIAARSSRVVVMSQRAVDILKETYSIPTEKIAYIPHGIHDLPFVDPHYYSDQFDMLGKRVLLTFGLLSPGKGIEVVIRAMPKIVEQNPEAMYIVLGATHPHVVRNEGERYRDYLKQLAKDLGVEKHVQFHDQYVTLETLGHYLGLADLYVTPYPNPAQITSGTLAYAVGAGKAVLSTPIWHSEELLADGRGVLFPFNDHEELARQASALLKDDEGRNVMRKKAYMHGRAMIWPEIGKAYVNLGATVLAERRFGRVQMNGPAIGALTPSFDDEPNLDHLERLTDDTGMLQHALFAIPDRRHGYCTDDNARALITAVTYDQQIVDPRAEKLAERYLTFLAYAFDDNKKLFRNFMGYDRKWLEEVGSDDSHNRAVWALGCTVATAKLEGVRLLAYRLFKAAMPAVANHASPRSWAFCILGMNLFKQSVSIDAAVNQLYALTAKRLKLFFQSGMTEAWPWPEPVLTYDNARLPQALLLAGHDLGDPEMIEIGLKCLDWLAELQTGRDGVVSLVGHEGWTAVEHTRTIFDQQPVEATAMVEACASAYRITHEAKWFDLAKHFHLWFLGNNAMGLPLRDPSTGGCADGLQAGGVNFNQGAESTLALLQSSLTIRDLYKRAVESSTSIERESVA